jgi:hypothetical protein
VAKAATANRTVAAIGARSGALAGARSLIWLSGLACGVLAAIVPGLAIVGLMLMGPGLVILRLDREPGRAVTRAVLTCGLAASVHPAMMLWNSGQSVGAAVAIISDPIVLSVAWGATAAGWLLAQIMPLLVRVVLEAASLAHATRLRTLRGRLVEDWGLDQADGA